MTDKPTQEPTAGNVLPRWDRFKIVQLGMLLFERTWAVRDMENIMVETAPFSFLQTLFWCARKGCQVGSAAIHRRYTCAMNGATTNRREPPDMFCVHTVARVD